MSLMSDAPEQVEVIVVPHTHWDREWYLTFEEFRYWLVRVLDRVIEFGERCPEFRFVLDGQTSPLLDYLAIRPEQKEKLRTLVESGQLQVGPWYTQPDEFLASGEALVRNLLLGHRIAQRFGGVMKEGYLPDSFGHIAQLPQILRGFGIDTVFLMRGADQILEKTGKGEFLWRGPDGSEVFVHAFTEGYDISLPQEPGEFTGFVQKLVALRCRACTGVVLLPLGGDHRGVPADLPSALTSLAEKLPGFRFRLGTFAEYAQILRKALLPQVEGELRSGGKRHFILSGVHSARIPLKQRNFSLETQLEKYAEPLAALAWLCGHDLTPFVWAAWELVLQNHAHDSICGTGVDEVHREMMVRYAKAEGILRTIIPEALRTVGARMSRPSQEGTSVLVFNPSPWPRNEEVKVEIGDIDVQECLLLDASGTLVPGRVVGARLVSENILQGVKHLHKKVLIFQAQVPPLGLKTYTVLPRTGLKNTSSLFVSPRVLENEFYRVEALPNGTIKLTDKESGDVFENLGFFEDAGDAGDEYNYSPPLHQEVWTSLEAKAQVRVAEDLPWRGTLRVDLALLLPKGLSEDRSARSPERVLCPATVFVSLQQGIKRVDIAVEVENNAGDHRLRLGFPTGLKNAVSYVEDAFWVLRRLPTEVDERDWIETPSKTQPQRSFVAVERAGKGFAVINRGLPEYEVTEDGTIFITLLRGVGWLSRDDLRTRRGHAGPPYPTPEAQCLGRHRFELALVTFRGTWEESNLLEVAEAFRAPLVGVELGEGGKPLLPPEMSFLCLAPRKLVLSAVKVAEDGEGLVVRVYNPTSHTIFGQIHLFAAPSRAEWTRLDETPQASVPPQNRIHFPLKSGEIRTLKMRFPRLFDSPSD